MIPFLLFIFSIVFLPQIIICFFSFYYKKPSIRKVGLLVHILLYYLAIYIAFLRSAGYHDSLRHCGMWMIGYYLLAAFGLCIPIAYFLAVFIFRKTKYGRQ